MHFTEDDLRAVLDDYSDGGTTPPRDVWRNAERAGRRLTRRRASTAGGVLAASALAVGATVAALPSAGADGTTHGTHRADGTTPAAGGDPVTLLPADGRIAAAQYTYREATHVRLTFTPRGSRAVITLRCSGDGRRIEVRADETLKAAITACARFADGNYAPSERLTGLTPGKPRTVDVTVVPPSAGTTGMNGSWAVGVYEQ
jgi:hypothetical protein